MNGLQKLIENELNILEAGQLHINNVCNPSLFYGVYWNMGCSGPETDMVKFMKKELLARNAKYSDEYAILILGHDLTDEA